MKRLLGTHGEVAGIGICAKVTGKWPGTGPQLGFSYLSVRRAMVRPEFTLHGVRRLWPSSTGAPKCLDGRLMGVIPVRNMKEPE